ncbi:hypothetical protein [uncultured Pseudoflavonifractor sp.]|uniref:hypothetical protein n=1 Tax=uncultured Pseudoflavonifractor sp. TaxID=1221379 RepID=UPI0025E6B823|nr:hypothetical protein [uncultured Pseudoflavonifractor sp.]
MNRKLIALGLSLALTLTGAPALAVSADNAFPSLNTYPGYADVPAGSWFESSAKICYETGLITGSDKGFEPYRTMAVSEAAAIAARMAEILDGGDGLFENPAGSPWYTGAVDYLKGLAKDDAMVLSLLSQPDQTVTRLGFLKLLSAALPADQLTAINSITSLPDTADADVLRFYNAGILTGVNEYGMFAGSNTLTRSEAAAMVARVAREELRTTFTPTFDAVVWASLDVPDTVYFQGNGKTVTSRDYLKAVLTAVSTLGSDFLWNEQHASGVTNEEWVENTAMSALGVTKDMATQQYKDLDLQVFYSRYLDLGGTTAQTQAYTLYVGTADDTFASYPAAATALDPAADSAGVVKHLLSELSKLTGWNLDASEIYVGKDGVTVAWADTCALYTGPAEPQKDEFHMYDANQLAYTLLDSVKRTIQCAFSPANPDSLDVWFTAADGSALKLDNLGVTLPIDQPYSHSLLESLMG